MKMSLADLRVFVHENYAISAFNQDFLVMTTTFLKVEKSFIGIKIRTTRGKFHTKIMRTEDSTKSI